MFRHFSAQFENLAPMMAPSRVAEQLGYNVISLDRDLEADIKCDILNWDYKQFPVGYFDVIWASPPCTEYSTCKTTGVQNIALANSIVNRTL